MSDDPCDPNETSELPPEVRNFSCEIHPCLKVILLILLSPLWVPMFFTKEAVERPAVMMAKQIVKNAEQVHKFLLLIFFFFFTWYIFVAIFGLWGFYQIFVNIGQCYRTRQLVESVEVLLSEKRNSLEEFFNRKFDSVKVGYEPLQQEI